MNLTSISEYLAGSAFSNGLRVQISGAESMIPYRMEVIERIVEKKDIIHFGCADHIEIIEAKIAKNIWFHKRLLSCANKCIGIDNNKSAVDFLKSKLSIPDLYCLNIDKEEIPSEITGRHYEFLILGEIIEHVDNPVMFLNTVHNKFKNHADRIIITTPNAFRWNNFKNAFKQVEIINSDHRYWFTPYTLSKVLYQAGYNEIDFQLVENFRPEKSSILKNSLFCRFPSFRDTILIQAKF